MNDRGEVTGRREGGVLLYSACGPYLGQSAVLCERQRDGLGTGGFVQTRVHAGAHVPGEGRGRLVWTEGG